MKHSVRFACLLAALLMVFPLVSCGEDTAAETQTTDTNADTAAVETEPADPLEHLPVNDYEGYDFRLQLRNDDKWVADQVAEEMTGEVVNDAVYKRNSETMDRYNIVISHSRSSNANGDTDAKATIQAGDDAYDLIINHPRNIHEYANQGLARNWNDLTYVDLTREWWDQDAAASFRPTCSEYALQAVQRYGVWKGGWMAMKRLGRCHPFSKRDYYDPVP